MPLIIHLATKNPYIPWDTAMFLKGTDGLLSAIGTAFNIGFWCFLGIMGIIVVKNIISYFLE